MHKLGECRRGCLGLTQYDELLELGVRGEHGENGVQVLNAHQASLVHHQNTHQPKPPVLRTAIVVFLRVLETQHHLEVCDNEHSDFTKRHTLL